MSTHPTHFTGTQVTSTCLSRRRELARPLQAVDSVRWSRGRMEDQGNAIEQAPEAAPEQQEETVMAVEVEADPEPEAAADNSEPDAATDAAAGQETQVPVCYSSPMSGRDMAHKHTMPLPNSVPECAVELGKWPWLR